MFCRSVPPLAAVVLALVAWQRRFVQDDAYISWRYAANLVHHGQLAWNLGERVEGYTSFLWTLAATVPIAAGLEVESSMEGLGIVLFTGTLLLFWWVTRRLTGRDFDALLGVIVLGSLPSFQAYATGGLETQLQTLLGLLVLALTLPEDAADLPTIRRPWLLGGAIAAALLTRLDSVVLLAAPVALAVVTTIPESRDARRRCAVALAAPALVVGVWLVWKLAYYGSVLPNTFRVKVAGVATVDYGKRYLAAFSRSYVPVAALLGWLLALWQLVARRRSWPVVGVAVTIPLWLSYILWVGGDFMEFRFMVPIMPGGVVLALWGARRQIGHWWGVAAIGCGIALGGLHHARTYTSQLYGGPESVELLAWHLAPDGEHWVEIGRTLRAAFPAEVRPSLAVTAAGAIPYYSDLPAVDMLGLSDPEIDHFQRLTFLIGGYNLPIGHSRLAPLALLKERGVTFLIGHPVLRSRAGMPPDARFPFSTFAARAFRDPDEETLRGEQVVEVPLSGGVVMLMVYLTPDAAVDARLDELGWRRYPLL
jgi:arabinofuranosyltransferase